MKISLLNKFSTTSDNVEQFRVRKRNNVTKKLQAEDMAVSTLSAS